MFNLKSFLTEKLSGKKPPWQDLFKLFKEIIDSNNRALDIITDLGEKLGGDYLFDIIYIKSAYHKLNNAVGTSIQKFNSLTQKKYAHLQKTFEGIDSRINAAIKDTAVIFGKAVLSYDDIAWDMAHEVGGKNLNLAEMKNQLKLNVPPGFAITTHAYDLFTEHNHLGTVIEGLSSADSSEDEQFDKLRDLVLKGEIPPAVSGDINSAVAILKSNINGPCFVAVRSSAEEEDGEFTFAGQFKTVLNVPAEKNSIEAAYKEVIASLFSREATAYLRNTGHAAGSMKMAVGCVLQIDAVSSGVIFSSNPENAADIMISASWGLGVSVVDGTVEPDLFMVKKPVDKSSGFKITDRKIGKKDSMAVLLSDGGTHVMATPADKINTPCLRDDQVYGLASRAVLIERHFGGLQDIEWAADKDGVIYILQARPIRLQEGQEHQDISIPAEAAIIMEGRGTVVQRGTGAGPVFIVNHEDEIENVPRGAVLVSKNDSSKFVKIMPYISAIITDTGASVSHMASVCREFKIPTLVNAGDATKILKAGKVVTLHIDNEGSAKVYEGFIKELVKTSRESVFGMESIGEYRKKRQLLRYISPLHLVDPLMEDFTVEGCRTIHDVLRFMHEKSVTELIDEARHRGVNTDSQATVRLELPIPAALMVVDIGGGLAPFNKKDKVGIKEVTSLPLASILKGMTYPGVWHSETVSLNVRDFLSSMVRMPDIRNDAESYVGYNLAVASREYVNLNLRFGYHFNMIDCYCSEKVRNNHIYFRFVGGATDIVKRSRRVNFIAEVLKEHGFGLNIKGDLLVARLSNISQDRVQELLDQLGRLISYTRQLDAMLHSDELVNRYTANFLAGKYGLN
jgi:pyruvate, water dikinase